MKADLPTTHFPCLPAAVSGETLDGACIEKLLLQYATALDNNDVTLAQQVMWVLNNVASSHGDPNQRLTYWFLMALLSRAARLCPTTVSFRRPVLTAARPMTVTELADYVDLTPWHRFGFCASNAAILTVVRDRPEVHIIDFGITHCMQWPTLIDALSKRPEGPPALRITVPSSRPPVPPSLTISIAEVGIRLSNFAISRDVPFEFQVIKCELEKPIGLFHQLLRDNETLVVNCQSWLRYLPDSSRDGFLKAIRGLNPRIVTITDEDFDADSPSLPTRIMACFNYLWIPFDALETFMPRDSGRRMEYEADVGRKIESLVGYEGAERIERSESCVRVAQRMRRAGFGSVPFGEEAVREVKLMLDEDGSGWGMKRVEEEVGEMLVLTWKGHSSVFTTAWTPTGFGE